MTGAENPEVLAICTLRRVIFCSFANSPYTVTGVVGLKSSGRENKPHILFKIDDTQDTLHYDLLIYIHLLLPKQNESIETPNMRVSN